MADPEVQTLAEPGLSDPVLRLTGEQIGSITPPPEGDWFVDWDEYEEFVPKRLLDAARVAPSPDAPGLLAALERIAKGHDWQPGQPTHGWASCQRIADAALAASGDAPREGLDVERLARVLAARDNRRDDVRRAVGVNERDPSTPAEFMRTAEAIAREYASESHPTKERTDG